MCKFATEKGSEYLNRTCNAPSFLLKKVKITVLIIILTGISLLLLFVGLGNGRNSHACNHHAPRKQDNNQPKI